MMLKNKKTGEIIEAESCNNTGGCISIYYEERDGQIGTKDCYTSLAELNDEWEDYEGPKAFGWRIDEYNDPEEIGFGFSLEELEYLKEIGLWFETREEAEQAVEKLKALKRLRDRGFRFTGNQLYAAGVIMIDASIGLADSAPPAKRHAVCDDLDICFGGEE